MLEAAPEIWRRREELSRAIRVREGRDPLLESATHLAASSGEPDDPDAHLAHLSEALACQSPELFETWIGWARRRVVGTGRAEHQLARSLESCRHVLDRRLPAQSGRAAVDLLDRGLSVLRRPAPDPPSHLDGRADGRLARAYVGALLAGDRAHATRLIDAASEQGSDRRALLLDVLQPALREVGRMWQFGRISVAQAHHAIVTSRLSISRLTKEADRRDAPSGTVIAACVGAEQHELGLRVVADVLGDEGWSVFWLGAGTSTGALVEETARRRADVVALSSSIGMHVRGARAAIVALRESSASPGVRVIVGGGSFAAVPDLWRSVGADAHAASAREAASCCAAWLPVHGG